MDNVNWHDVWNKMMSQCTEVALKDTGGLKEWSLSSARDYSKGTDPDYIEAVISKLGVGADDRVLDIGCGPGTLAIPLAKIVKSVTTVDMSPNMLKVLRERASAENLSNIACVNKQWRDVVVGSDIDRSYDAVVASNSFSLLAAKETKCGDRTCVDWDVIDAVKKMNAVGRKVYVTMPLGESSPFSIYDVIGIPYHPPPNHVITYNVISETGVLPDIDLLPSHHRGSSDPKATVKMLEWKHKLTDAQRAALAAKLESIADPARQPVRVFLLIHWRNKVPS